MGEIDLLVLASVAPEGSRTAAIAERLGQSEETVRAAVVRLVRADLLQVTDDGVTLTPRGQLAAEDIQRSRRTPTAAGDPVPVIDLNQVLRLISASWPSGAKLAAAEEAERHDLLASDVDRDAAVQQLADAFSEGRLSSTDLEQRSGKALAARTYGELDDVLEGLGGLQRRTQRPSRAQGRLLRGGVLLLPVRHDGRAVLRLRGRPGRSRVRPCAAGPAAARPVPALALGVAEALNPGGASMLAAVGWF